MKTIKKIFRIFFKILKWIFFIIAGLAIVSALYNLTLPERSTTIEHLSAKEKSFIAEAMNLQRRTGNEVWPGWGDTVIPVIVYNEAYAFLLGYPDPPAGWLKMPGRDFRGAGWEKVSTDDYFGETYYRQPLPDPEITPENFTVLVGDRWVATLQTSEYSAVAFYKGFREELPPVLNAVFPYKLFWHAIMGTAEKYIAAMLHEAFHAFQGTRVPGRLASAEQVAYLENDYPWHDPANANGWKTEIERLFEAYQTEDNELARQLTAQFLNDRKARRQKSNLTAEFIQYEQKREWLEGLAKYAELTVGLNASQNQDYSSIDAIRSFSEFKGYTTFADYYHQQLGEVRRVAGRSDENRFYYSGLLQAVMLDRLMPGWKNSAFEEDVYLEDLLEEAVETLPGNSDIM